MNQMLSSLIVLLFICYLMVGNPFGLVATFCITILLALPTIFEYGLSLTLPLVFRWMLLLLGFLYIGKYENCTVKRLLLFLKALIIVNTLLVVFQLYGINSVNIQGITRYTGSYGNPNLLGIHMAIYALMLLQIHRSYKGIKIFILLSCALLLLSGSLTSVFIFLFGIIYKYRPPTYIIILIAFACIGFLAPYIIDRISIVVDLDRGQLTEASSVLWRFQAWSIYLADIDNVLKLLFGNGLGSSRLFLMDSSLKFRAPGTHNDYLAVLYDYGLTGLIVFLHLIIKVVRYVPISLRVLIFALSIAMFWDNYIDTVLILLLFYFFRIKEFYEVQVFSRL